MSAPEGGFAGMIDGDFASFIVGACQQASALFDLKNKPGDVATTALPWERIPDFLTAVAAGVSCLNGNRKPPAKLDAITLAAAKIDETLGRLFEAADHPNSWWSESEGVWRSNEK